MQPNEQSTSNEGKPFRRRINWELYYYERVGNRLYFRITPFAIILMLVAAIAGVTIFIIDSIKHPSHETDINITVPPDSSYPSNNTIIQPALPPPSTRKIGKHPAFVSPSLNVLSPKNGNINKQSLTQPTPTP